MSTISLKPIVRKTQYCVVTLQLLGYCLICFRPKISRKSPYLFESHLRSAGSKGLA